MEDVRSYFRHEVVVDVGVVFRRFTSSVGVESTGMKSAGVRGTEDDVGSGGRRELKRSDEVGVEGGWKLFVPKRGGKGCATISKGFEVGWGGFTSKLEGCGDEEPGMEEKGIG